MNKKQYALMNWEQIESICYADCANPFSILGLHTKKKEIILQAFFPEAEKVSVVLNTMDGKKKKIEMEKVDESGFFAVFLTKEKFSSYSYTVDYVNTQCKDILDPYAYPVSFDDKTAASMKRGTNEELMLHLGSHPTKIGNTEGVVFHVYAPNANCVSLLADFNQFKEGAHLMEKNESTGVFSLFIPGAKEGLKYRYAVRGKGAKSVEKTDPFSLYEEVNASVVTKNPSFGKSAKKVKIDNPSHFYEVDLFSLLDDKAKTCTDLLPVLIKHCKEYHYHGIHLLNIFEPVATAEDRFHVKGLFAASATLGGPEALGEFIKAFHDEGLFVSFQFPVAFFSSDPAGLHFFDGESLFESSDERVMFSPAFGGYCFDFSKGFVVSYLLSAALYLVNTYHFDGILIPDLAALLYLDYGKNDGEWIPNEYGGNLNLAAVRFIKKLNTKLSKKFPNLYKIASSDGVLSQVTTKSGKDSLLFDAVLNTGFENGLVSYLQNDPFFRSEHYYDFTKILEYAFSEEFILPLSHISSSKDFVSLKNRMPGILEDKQNNVILANAFLSVFPGKKWNFMGTDNFCEEAYFANPYALALKEAKGQEKAISCIKDLFALYHDKTIYHPVNEGKESFEMIKCDDPADNVVIYRRKEGDVSEFIIFNFSNHEMDKYSFGLPEEGKIKEIFTTDDEKYARAGFVNKNAVSTKEIPMDGFKQSVTVKIPAMGMQIFSYRPFTEKEKAEIEKKKYMEKVRYVEKKKKEIEAERDRLIDEAKKEAERKIKEVEKILKQ